MTLFKDLIFRLIMLASILALISLSVSADQCSPICGRIEPTTLPIYNLTCFYTGYLLNDITGQINWSDGGYSVITTNYTFQLVIGSCCSHIQLSIYSTGTVAEGRFAGQPVIETLLISDDNQMCDNGCETISGSARISVTQLTFIGTKGVGQWIECTGKSTVLFSPAITSIPQTVYATYSVDFTCSDCIESC